MKKRIKNKMMRNPGRYKLHQYLKYAHQWGKEPPPRTAHPIFFPFFLYISQGMDERQARNFR